MTDELFMAYFIPHRLLTVVEIMTRSVDNIISH